MELKTHTITLRGERVTLRPMTEADWLLLLRWNSDPEVLYFSEGDDVQSYSLDDVQGIYRTTSQTALCFIMEYQGRPIGECWLQRMNMERILSAYPGFDLRRIDLMIGEKSLWGQGLGSEVIGLLTRLAFEQEGADYVFSVGVADYNARSRRAFEKNDYRLVARNPEPPGMKARFTLDLLAKNPRLGFHAYAVHLFFDPHTEAAIRAAWKDLAGSTPGSGAEAGVAPYLYYSANRPHLTLSIYRALDLPEARRRLAELAARQAALPLSFQYHGLFPGAHPVTFAGPLVTAPLLDLQAEVCRRLDEVGQLPVPEMLHYRPGHWIPHCGLATDFAAARLEEALRISHRLELPLQGQIQEIGLTEMRPVRHLCQWPLCPAGHAVE